MKKTVGEKIIDILKENLDKGFFKEYFYGDNMEIPQSLLPCVIVEKSASTHQTDSTGMEKIDEVYVVKLLINKKDEFGKSSTESPGSITLENLAEGIDETTDTYSTKSVLGILRKYFTLENTVYTQGDAVEYGVVPRPNDIITAEAHITVATSKLVVVNSRQ